MSSPKCKHSFETQKSSHSATSESFSPLWWKQDKKKNCCGGQNRCKLLYATANASTSGALTRQRGRPRAYEGLSSCHEYVSGRQRGLSAGYWPRACCFTAIGLACLSSRHCQLRKGMPTACPLMRRCSYAFESVQHSNRSRMAAQWLPIAPDWPVYGAESWKEEEGRNMRSDSSTSFAWEQKKVLVS